MFDAYVELEFRSATVMKGVLLTYGLVSKDLRSGCSGKAFKLFS